MVIWGTDTMHQINDKHIILLVNYKIKIITSEFLQTSINYMIQTLFISKNRCIIQFEIKKILQ